MEGSSSWVCRPTAMLTGADYNAARLQVCLMRNTLASPKMTRHKTRLSVSRVEQLLATATSSTTTEIFLKLSMKQTILDFNCSKAVQQASTPQVFSQCVTPDDK